ncbi:MAG: endonuclease Q family protein [Desulfuromonadales bacterium]|nr:endonuclease Q family protein [Desulfuromonadales bacterium]
MDFIADLHIHSSYSRATSKDSNLQGLAGWGALKGINVIGTGDFTHPVWLEHLKKELEPAEPGFFRIKNKVSTPFDLRVDVSSVRFLLSSEISSIYKKGDKVRKVHNLLYLPDFDSVDRINSRLAKIGNIVSDGRPILKLDSHDLLEILLEEAPEGFCVPAHIWTPWFSIFGSRSGFDSVEECFGDLSEHIFALETGLSSDPFMNRLISSLDRYALISNSDCHSPGKLGREANIFSTGFDFFSLRDAIRNNSRESFKGTIEFFPEEGKYHYDGHRDCGVSLEPKESKKLGNICPVCGKPLTIGVDHRVLDLADRVKPVYRDNSPGFFSLIPLPELIGELLGVAPSAKKVTNSYIKALQLFGSEFNLLLNASIAAIERHSPLMATAISRVRSGSVIKEPGYDGKYGLIRAFSQTEHKEIGNLKDIFVR